MIGGIRQLNFEDRGGNTDTSAAAQVMTQPPGVNPGPIQNNVPQSRCKCSSTQLGFPICDDRAGAEAGADDI